jgi:phage-related protein
MKEERIQKLNDIGFEWSVTAVATGHARSHEDSWYERFEQLKAFQKEHGHSRVPLQKEKDSATHQLGSWVSRQRQQYKLLREDKKGFIITEKRIQKLNGIGFDWSVITVDWDERLEQLKAFQKEHGHSRVPLQKEKVSATYQLAMWVSKQRSQYTLLHQGKKSQMKAERIQKLNDIGFDWSVTAVDWDERFEQLKAFQKEHGHCRVPGRYDQNSATHQPAVWVSKQREQYKFLQQGKKSQMKEERIQRLNAIGFEWFLHQQSKPWG